MSVGVCVVVVLAALVVVSSVLLMWQSSVRTISSMDQASNKLYQRSLEFEAETRGSLTDLSADTAFSLNTVITDAVIRQVVNQWSGYIGARATAIAALVGELRLEGRPLSSTAAINATVARLQASIFSSIGSLGAPCVFVMGAEGDMSNASRTYQCLFGRFKVACSSPLLQPVLGSLGGNFLGGTLTDLQDFATGSTLTEVYKQPDVVAALARAGGVVANVTEMFALNILTSAYSPTAVTRALAPSPGECIIDATPERCGALMPQPTRDMCGAGWRTDAGSFMANESIPFYASSVLTVVSEWFSGQIYMRVPASPAVTAATGFRSLGWVGTYYEATSVNAMLAQAVQGTSVTAFVIASAALQFSDEVQANLTHHVYTWPNGSLHSRVPLNGSILVAVSDGTAYKRIIKTASPLGQLVALPPENCDSPPVYEVARALRTWDAFQVLRSASNVTIINSRTSTERYFVEVKPLPGSFLLLVTVLPESAVLGRLWAQSARLAADRLALLDSLAAQRASDRATGQAIMNEGVGVAVAVSVVVSLLGTLGAIVAVWAMSRELVVLGGAMSRTARLESVFDRSYLGLVPSPLADVAELQDAYKRIAQSMFSFARYLPIEVCRQLAVTGDAATLGLTPRHVVVLFSDIQDFTAISERSINTLSALSECLAGYFEEVTDAIAALNGSVDKFIGDAVMALWGAVEPSDRGPLDAVAAAMRMQYLVRDLRAFWAVKLPGTVLRVRAGLNAGRCLVGNIGSSARYNFTALGDPVNLASRLEGANKVFGTATLVSQSVMESDGVAESFPNRLLGALAVKGRTAAVRVYEVPDSILADLGPGAGQPMGGGGLGGEPDAVDSVESLPDPSGGDGTAPMSREVSLVIPPSATAAPGDPSSPGPHIGLGGRAPTGMHALAVEDVSGSGGEGPMTPVRSRFGPFGGVGTVSTRNLRVEKGAGVGLSLGMFSPKGVPGSGSGLVGALSLGDSHSSAGAPTPLAGSTRHRKGAAVRDPVPSTPSRGALPHAGGVAAQPPPASGPETLSGDDDRPMSVSSSLRGALARRGSRHSATSSPGGRVGVAAVTGAVSADELRRNRARELQRAVAGGGAVGSGPSTPHGQKLAVPMMHDHLRMFTEAADAYLSRDFVKAAQLLSTIAAWYPDDRPTQVLIAEVERVRTLPDWDGAMHLMSK